MKIKAVKRNFISEEGKTSILIVLTLTFCILVGTFIHTVKSVKAESSDGFKKGNSSCKNCFDVEPFFKVFNKDIREFRTLDRRKINSDYSIAVVWGIVPSSAVNYELDIQELLRQEAFGIFIVDNSTQKHYMTIDIFPSKRFFDYRVDIEEVTDHYLIISRQGREYGDQYERTKYFYDLKKKEVLNKLNYQKMYIFSIIEFDKSIYFFGNDGNKTVITKLKSFNGNNLNYEIVEKINGEAISKIDKVEKQEGNLILRNESNDYIFTKGEWVISKNLEPEIFKYNPGWGDKIGLPFLGFWVPIFKIKENLLLIPNEENIYQKFLVWNSKISVHSFKRGVKGFLEKDPPGIYELDKDRYKNFYKFPNPEYKLFKRLRPKRVRDGYTEDSTVIEVDIGPFQLVNKKLWFGTSFYDGEGTTGIGGIGYFDFETRKYRINYLKEIADWSTSSIYVDNEHIWLGLVGYPEGAAYSGGLAKYNIKSGKTIKYAVPEIINTIYKFDEKLYLGTSDGVYILSDRNLHHIGFSLDINSNYSLLLERVNNIP